MTLTALADREEENTQNAFAPVEELIAAIKAGRMVVLVDDESRENEGDLIVAADKVTPEIINFMAMYGRGLICLAMDDAIAKRLELAPMVSRNRDKFATDFLVSIEAREGVTTGISAADRARTVQVAADPQSGAADIVTPGHIFPIRAKSDGVLERAGHTEAAVDLAKLAGYSGAGVICEIMKDDGTMARVPDLIAFAGRHDLLLGTIESLIAYRKDIK